MITKSPSQPYRRRPDWPVRLDAFIEQRRRTPFAWGVHDCCQFAREGVRALTGVDPAKGWGLRRYTTAKGAASTLKRLGGVAAIPERAGCMRLPRVALAQRGDIVEREGVLGICVGAHVAMPGATGLIFTSLLDCTSAWRVA